MTDVTRTQDEIVARIAAVTEADWLGFEVLLEALDYEHAKPFLGDGVTAEAWTEATAQPPIGQRAREYYEFALGKIEGHRGISAERSVEKLTEFAWLLGRDDVVAAMEEAPYAQYGAPKVKAFADGMGWPWPDKPDLTRMAQGLPCEDGCESGCGQ